MQFAGNFMLFVPRNLPLVGVLGADNPGLVLTHPIKNENYEKVNDDVGSCGHDATSIQAQQVAGIVRDEQGKGLETTVTLLRAKDLLP